MGLFGQRIGKTFEKKYLGVRSFLLGQFTIMKFYFVKEIEIGKGYSKKNRYFNFKHKYFIYLVTI